MAKEVRYSGEGIEPVVLVWSLDGTAIGAIFSTREGTWIVDAYNTVSGTKASSDTYLSSFAPCLWPHKNSLQVMTIPTYDDVGVIVDIFEVWPSPNDYPVESFSVESNSLNEPIRSLSFSPSTYQISVITNTYTLLAFDIQNSRVLLQEEDFHGGIQFSPNGDVLVANGRNGIQFWKYTSNGGYIKWKIFPYWNHPDDIAESGIQVSPTLSSFLIPGRTLLEVLYLDGPVTDPPLSEFNYHSEFSANGVLVITAPIIHDRGATITITNLHKNSSEFIDTELEIHGLALTGNVLLVEMGMRGMFIVAWRLTAEGTVDGTLGIGRADHSNSLWAKKLQGSDTQLWVEGHFGVIGNHNGDFIYYNIETGEELESVPVAVPPLYSSSWKYIQGPVYEDFKAQPGAHHLIKYNDPPDNLLISIPWYKDGWVIYPGGEHQHQFWLPPHWRSWIAAQWIDDITTLRLYEMGSITVIKF